MEELARFVMDSLDSLVGALVHVAFWKLGAGVLLGAALALFVSTLPEEYRSSARAVVLLALGLIALGAASAPVDLSAVLG